MTPATYQKITFPEYSMLDDMLTNLRIVRKSCKGYGDKGQELVALCDKMIEDTLRVKHLYGEGVYIRDA